MKKRLISGLLALMMLATTAFAAGDAPVRAAEQMQQAQLEFGVTLPDEYSTDRMEDALADEVLAVLRARLAALGLADAALVIGEDRKSVAVTLPAGVSPDGIEEEISRPGVLTVTDAAGETILTAQDVTAAETDEAGGVRLHLAQLDAQKTAAVAQAETLVVALDGMEVAGAAMEGDWLALAFPSDDDASGAAVAAYLVAGALPVKLTLRETPAQQTPEPPAETEEPTEQPEQPTEEPTEQPEQPEPPAVFPDIAGHWAERALTRGVSLGLLSGIDGKMLPNNALKRAEAVALLNRTLGASVEDSSVTLEQGAWYAPELRKAAHLGLIAADDSRSFNTAATRAEAFALFARAFGYDRAAAADGALAPFTDADSMTPAQQRAAAALVSAGIVGGKTATTLAPQGSLTRAEFVTMLLRIVGTFPSDTPETAQAGGVLVTESEAFTLDEVTSDSDYIFACGADEVRLRGGALGGRVVLKGMEDAALTASGTEIALLALDAAGAAKATLTGGAAADTLVIAGAGGETTFAGAARAVEITASNRTIHLSGMQAETLTVTGSGNTIVMDGAAAAVTIAAGAMNNKLTLNRAADTVLVSGIGSTVDGSGKAKEIDIRAVDCTVTLNADAKTENIDAGLHGVGIKIGVPNKVTPGGSLRTVISFTGVTEPKICTAQWYEDGKPLAGFRNDNFTLAQGQTTSRTTYFTFTKNMKTSVTVGFKLTYQNPSTGETEEVFEQTTVPIENHSAEWYFQRDASRVLGLVSSTYRGNYTAAYAINNDYQPYEKEIWVNAKGYSSNSKYLIWINRAYQHVNIFEGKKGSWKLIKSYLVGTGAASSPTPTGVTTVSYKLKGGWTTGSYTVRPVVGFYPGTGYAFHSRLCYPGTDREYDFSGGYPVSHGCIRMNKPDVQWIYDNIPVGTTVVIH